MSEYYQDVHVSTFEKRGSNKMIDRKTLSHGLCDDELRIYFRKLRHATMINPIDYVCQPETFYG